VFLHYGRSRSIHLQQTMQAGTNWPSDSPTPDSQMPNAVADRCSSGFETVSLGFAACPAWPAEHIEWHVSNRVAVTRSRTGFGLWQIITIWVGYRADEPCVGAGVAFPRQFWAVGRRVYSCGRVAERLWYGYRGWLTAEEFVQQPIPTELSLGEGILQNCPVTDRLSHCLSAVAHLYQSLSSVVATGTMATDS
jgi:hypothetical protein